MEHDPNEGRISCQVCNNFVNYHYVDTYVYRVDLVDKTPKIDYNKIDNAQ